MAFKVKIDNVEYDLKDNFTIKDELNETLDSATIQFNTYGQEANFESFDVAQIYDSENKITTKHMLVDSFDDEIHSFGSNFETDDHLYTVSLFSETKELERITLPNCSVTQPRTGTKKSVRDEIFRFFDLYVPCVKVYSSSNPNHYVYVKKYSLDNRIRTRFSNIDCPEFQWNNPTLREVLNDLVSTDDCIIVVKEGIISFYDLKQKGNPIDVSKLSFSKKSMSSQDYVGELTLDMQNAIGKEPSLVCEGVTLRAPEGEGSLTTINGVIKTQSPIYAIKKLKIKVPFMLRKININSGTEVERTYNYAWIDVTDRVIEKEEFELLSNVKINTTAWDNLDEYVSADGHAYKKHKVNFLYFSRGGDSIFNIGTNYPILHLAITEQTYFAMAGINLSAYVPSSSGGYYYVIERGVSANENADPRNFQFYIEYETVAEHALRVGKYLPAKHPENRVFDNQSNSYVDQEHMSIYEYAKINRLGHKIRNIAGNYYSESEIPELGDYIGDEILFSREITYQDNMFNFKGMLCPNYVLRDFFTGVRAKKRSWQIAKNEDALIRHDIYKFYIEASFNEKTDTFDNNYGDGIINIQGDAIVPYLIPFYEANARPFQVLACAVNTASEGGDRYPAPANYIMTDTQNTILGRSFCIDFGFSDNFKSADYIVSDGSELTQSFYQYADENGEFLDAYFYLFDMPLQSGGSDSQRTETTQANLIASIRDGYEKPKIDNNDIPNTSHTRYFVANVQKDNREIIRSTIQFEFCSDTEDIIITNKFLKRIIYVDKEPRSATQFFVYTSGQKYKKDDTQVKGNTLGGTLVFKTSNNQNARISVLDLNGYAAIPSGVKSWAVVDDDGDLLLAVNLPKNASRMECWFNLLRYRDDKVYSDNYNGVVVGDISDSGLANLQSNYNAVTTRASTSVRIQGRNVVRSETITGDDENE